LAVEVRVVHDGCEEVDRLDECRPSIPAVHTRIVCSPEVDQDPVILLRR
jgi:hypothetical protein